MSRENVTFQDEKCSGRITRARAKELSESGGILCSSKSSGIQKPFLRANSKRMASDDISICSISSNGFPNKRRAVLKDVTNISTKGYDNNCNSTSNIQGAKPTRRVSAKAKANVPLNVHVDFLGAEEDADSRLAEDLSKIRVVESREVSLRETLDEKETTMQTMCHTNRGCGVSDMVLSVSSKNSIPQPDEKNMTPEQSAASNGRGIIDIDSNSKCLQSCSIYATDIYDRIRVTELDQRATTNYMEQLQQDVTANMRGILVDWLVEVSEEYKLVPDTLYLTVNVIDRFLSQNCIEKKRLQLLGVASMLIASKYEEICAPRVEDFCFITDNTYTKREVVDMESEVLNLLHFRLSVPTTKTFLRRFVQSAHASYKVPCIELEFLANYLAELTLVEYSFLKFLPSLIAASAVFLARWTLDQSGHPWNPTLEHYTSYNTSELKTVVLALQDLQLNTSASSLNSIREKYKQPKMAESYVADERVGNGIAEPGSGAEFYFCPPHKRIIERIGRILVKETNETLNSIENGLIGLSPNSTSHHKCSSKKQHLSSKRQHETSSVKVNIVSPKCTYLSVTTTAHPPSPGAVDDDGNEDEPPGFGLQMLGMSSHDDIPERQPQSAVTSPHQRPMPPLHLHGLQPPTPRPHHMGNQPQQHLGQSTQWGPNQPNNSHPSSNLGATHNYSNAQFYGALGRSTPSNLSNNKRYIGRI